MGGGGAVGVTSLRAGSAAPSRHLAARRIGRPVVTSLRIGSAAHLPVGEAVPAGALAARPGITRPTLARLVAEARDRVVRLGRTRATAYAVRQPTAAGSEWPLFRLRADATTPHW